MSNKTISPASLILRVAMFVGIFGVLYGICIVVFPQVKVGSTTVMKLAARNPVSPGGFGYTLQRFRDVEKYREVDILFLGSSHAYRTYDTRVYEEAGYSAFNMGTTGQTPLNSYYLMKRYWQQLQPRVVVLDLVYRVIDRDGLECFYDLSSNMSYSKEFLQMALEIHSPYAINASLGMWSSSLIGDDAPEARQKLLRNEFYIPGGYVEFETWNNDSVGTGPIKTSHIEPNPQQLRFIRKIIYFARRNGAKVVLVTKPEPRENLVICANYDELSATFANIAAKAGEQFWDFNRIMEPLDWHKHFHDREYLNAPGVLIYNSFLLEKLRNEGYLHTADNE
ncbi:MAG: hypothetical protein ACRBF0_00640 [Calditrichia bacterium]